MNRLMLLVVVAGAFLAVLRAQDRPVGTLPPGPADGTAWLIDALFVQANMFEGGRVLFLVPVSEPSPKKDPPPGVFAKVARPESVKGVQPIPRPSQTQGVPPSLCTSCP